MEIHKIDLPNVGLVRCTVPKDLFEKIKGSVDCILQDLDAQESWASNLAGQIRKEYSYNYYHEELSDLVLAMCDFHIQTYDYVRHLMHNEKTGRNSYRFLLEKSWINLQSKHEFNPIHHHSGIFSFVMWVTVPYFINFEHSVSPGIRSSTPKSGLFDIIYTDCLGAVRTQSIPADKSYEGEIILFPSKLNHGVYPFYSSDHYRVSISGNISAELLKNEPI